MAFTRWKVAVFVDGCFWHGHPKFFTPGKSGRYWDEKIARNRYRDRITNRAWKEDMQVLHEIHGKLRRAVAAIERPRLDERMRRLLFGVACHDVYHAGQIRLLRKMLAR